MIINVLIDNLSIISNFLCWMQMAASPPKKSFGGREFWFRPGEIKIPSLLKGFSLPKAAGKNVNVLHERLLIPCKGKSCTQVYQTFRVQNLKSQIKKTIFFYGKCVVLSIGFNRKNKRKVKTDDSECQLTTAIKQQPTRPVSRVLLTSRNHHEKPLIKTH